VLSPKKVEKKGIWRGFSSLQSAFGKTGRGQKGARDPGKSSYLQRCSPVGQERKNQRTEGGIAEFGGWGRREKGGCLLFGKKTCEGIGKKRKAFQREFSLCLKRKEGHRESGGTKYNL